MEHKCKTCCQEMPNCESGKIVFGIDINPKVSRKDADKVVECEGYIKRESI